MNRTTASVATILGLSLAVGYTTPKILDINFAKQLLESDSGNKLSDQNSKIFASESGGGGGIGGGGGGFS